ncbi:reduction of Rh1 [Arctopsyche grandis]|uniref:reduction of Rh1 n=1 Tax=Arctopsyche grandis TaxID=121162 RepID=UPI00406D981E
MSEGPPARPMKYPYTYSAKLAQFPYKFHINNQWFYKYYIFGFAATVPIFYYFQKLSNSPGNVAKFAEAKRKEAEELAHGH